MTQSSNVASVVVCRHSPKKVTAAIFSNNSSLVAFADKFGDVLTVKLQPNQSAPTSGPAAPLLGHLCSVVTSLAFSPDSKHLVSTDQDCKVRVSTMPSEPHKVHELLVGLCSQPCCQTNYPWPCLSHLVIICTHMLCRAPTPFKVSAWVMRSLRSAAALAVTRTGHNQFCCQAGGIAPSGVCVWLGMHAPSRHLLPVILRSTIQTPCSTLLLLMPV